MLIRSPAPAANDDDARDNLAALVQVRSEQFAPLSRMIGRPDGYLRRWTRGDVRDPLAADERCALARYFGVDPGVLGGPTAEVPQRRPTFEKKSLRRRRQ